MSTDWMALKKPPAPWHIPQRWRVRRVRLRLNDMWGNWAVYPSWEPRPFSNADSDTHFFATHAEALAYADQRARTHEVVLPRLSTSGKHTVDRIEFDPVTITHHPHHLVKLTLGEWEGVGLTYAELEPVALYLLALAKQQEGAR